MLISLLGHPIQFLNQRYPCSSTSNLKRWLWTDGSIFRGSCTTSRGTYAEDGRIIDHPSIMKSPSRLLYGYFLCNYDPTLTTIYCSFMNRTLVLFVIFERQFPNSFLRAQMISRTSPIDIGHPVNSLIRARIPCVLPLYFQPGLRGLSSRNDLTRTSLFSHPLVVDHEKRQ